MNVSQMLDMAYNGFKNGRIKDASLPESMSILWHFRHRYENSHSDMLAALLNPKLRRPQNADFLKSFLSFNNIDFPTDLNLNDIQILREHGRVDLLILFQNTCVIVENKLDAEDQPAQLARYYRFVKEEYPSHTDTYVLYLSLDGKEPSDQSIGKDNPEYSKEFDAIAQLKTTGHFKCISYKKEIYEWLKQICEKIREDSNFLETKGRLFSAVDQYLYNVEILTHQTKGDNIMSEEILKSLQEWEKSGTTHKPEELLSFYSNLAPLLPYLIIYHEFKLLEQKLKEAGHEPVYFSHLQKIDEANLLTAIANGKNIGIGIPVSSIPKCEQFNLKNTYIVYELLPNRNSLCFGLATSVLTTDPEDREFQIGNQFDDLLEKYNYRVKNQGHWLFMDPDNRRLGTGNNDEVGLDDLIVWFKGLYKTIIEQ
ncbi:MAG: PD-(D/E)XK nuclease family protein [Brevinema sp.]